MENLIIISLLELLTKIFQNKCSSAEAPLVLGTRRIAQAAPAVVSALFTQHSKIVVLRSLLFCLVAIFKLNPMPTTKAKFGRKEKGRNVMRS